MQNFKNCLKAAAEGQELQLLSKITLYCKFQTFGRDNFNVRITFHSEKLADYRALKIAAIMSKHWGEQSKDVEENIEHEHWGRKIHYLESEYFISCGNLNEYRQSAEIAQTIFEMMGINCEVDYYSESKVPYTDDELRVLKLQNELEDKIKEYEHRIDRLFDVQIKAERNLSDILYSKWLKKELRNAESIEEVLANPIIAKSIAEINIYKTKIKKYDKVNN